MELSQYLKSLGRGGKTEFAKKIDVSKSFLRQMETGGSKIPPNVAKRIEEKSGGAVKKEELRPDLWEG